MRDENLRAIEQIVAALPHGRRTRAGGITPRPGLRQSEAPENLPARQQWDVPSLLGIGPEVHDRRCAERRVRTDGDRVGAIDLGQFVEHDDVAQRIESGSAELLGPWNAHQAQLGHLLDVVPGELTIRIELRRDRRDFLLGEGADHLAHLQVLLAEVERVVHYRAPLIRVRNCSPYLSALAGPIPRMSSNSTTDRGLSTAIAASVLSANTTYAGTFSRLAISRRNDRMSSSNCA